MAATSKTKIANLKGNPGDEGPRGGIGLPGVNAVANDTATATYAETEGTETKGVLDANYAAVAAFNFLPNSLRRSRAMLAAAIAGIGWCDILNVGDSVSAGTGVSVSTGTQSYSARLRDLLIARGVKNGGTGWVWPAHNANPAGSNLSSDPRWDWTNFTANTGAGTAAAAGFIQSTTAGATASFASDFAGTSMDFQWTSNSSEFRYRVLNEVGTVFVDWTTLNPTGTPLTTSVWVRQSITFPGQPAAKYRIEFQNIAGGFIILGPVRVNGATPGMRVSNAAVGGASSTTWRSDQAWYQNGPATRTIAGDHQLVLVESTMINDAALGITPETTHKANLIDQINFFRGGSGSPDVILWIPPHSSMSDALHQRYVTAAKEVALDRNVPLLDMSARFGSFADATGLGLMYDTAHPSTAGYADIANAFVPVLMP